MVAFFCHTTNIGNTTKTDTREAHRPSDQDVNWMSPVQRESPLVEVKEPYGNFDMVTCRLSSCNPECTKYTCR